VRAGSKRGRAADQIGVAGKGKLKQLLGNGLKLLHRELVQQAARFPRDHATALRLRQKKTTRKIVKK
jgi:hypothetical protein